jgi:O-antigen/teichoic acid export membrane protein
MEKESSDKAVEIGKISASGSIYLFVGRISSTVIAAIGTIILGLLIIESDYGLFTVALIPSATLLLFQDWGVGPAITRRCAQFRASNNESNLRKTIVAGLTFEFATALFLTLISILTANFVASVVFGQPSSAFLIVLASISILSGSIFTVIQSVFVGFDRMKLIAFVSIIQAIVQSITAPVLVLLGYGALGAMIGFVLTSVVGCLISIVLLYALIFKKIPHVKISKSDLSKTLRPLLHYGIPLAIGGMLAGLLIQFNSLLMASYIKDLTAIGNYKVSTNFAVLLAFFTVPINTVLFPAFSKLDPKKELDLVKTVFASSIKYSALILVPATMILIVLSTPIIGALYGDKWAIAPQFLALGSLTVMNFASGLGDTKIVLKLTIVQLAIGGPLALILIPWAGINGMIIGLLISSIPGLFIYLYLAWKKYGVKIDYGSSAKIFLSSLLSAMVVYAFLTIFPLSDWIQLGVGLLFFLIIYLTSVSLFGTLKQNDINNLRAMFHGLGIISKLLEIPMTFIEILIKRKSSMINFRRKK